MGNDAPKKEYDTHQLKMIEHVEQVRTFLTHADLERIVNEYPHLLPLYLAALKAVC